MSTQNRFGLLALLVGATLGAAAHGDPWVASNDGLPTHSTGRIVLVPGKPNTLYTTTGHALFRSTDHGKHWSEITVDGKHVNAFALDPKRVTTLYASVDREVFLSTDDGRTWRQLTHDAHLTFVTSLAVAATTPRTVYAAMSRSGLSASRDGGATWTPSDKRNGLDAESVERIVLHPTNAKLVYAFGRGGVSVTTDAGATWAAVGNLSDGPMSLAIAPLAPSTLYLGGWNHIYKSEDAGTTWRSTTGQTAFTATVAIDPKHTDIAYGGTASQGLLKTTDGARTWARIDTTLPSAEYLDLTVDPSHVQVLYATRADGVLRSDDGGRSWLPTLTGAQSAGDMGDVFFDQGTPHRAYAIRRSGSGSFISDDGGTNWRALGSVEGSYFTSIGSAASDSRVVYAINNKGVYRSKDAGASWESATDALLAKGQIGAWQYGPSGTHGEWLFVDPNDANSVLIGLLGRGVFNTRDGGKRWEQVEAGLTPSPRLGRPSFELAMDAQRHLWMKKQGELVRMADDGARWRSAASGETSPFAPAVELDLNGSPEGGNESFTVHTPTVEDTSGKRSGPRVESITPTWSRTRPEIGYAVAPHSRLLVKTTDGGRSWRRLSNPGLGDRYSIVFAIDPTNPDLLLLATDTGIFRSTTGGE